MQKKVVNNARAKLTEAPAVSQIYRFFTAQGAMEISVAEVAPSRAQVMRPVADSIWIYTFMCAESNGNEPHTKWVAELKLYAWSHQISNAKESGKQRTRKVNRSPRRVPKYRFFTAQGAMGISVAEVAQSRAQVMWRANRVGVFQTLCVFRVQW